MPRKCPARSSGTGSRHRRVRQQCCLILGTEPDAGLPGEASGFVWSHRGHEGTGEGVNIEVPALGELAGPGKSDSSRATEEPGDEQPQCPWFTSLQSVKIIKISRGRKPKDLCFTCDYCGTNSLFH